MLKKARELNFDQKKEGYTLPGRPSFGTGAPNGAPNFFNYIAKLHKYLKTSKYFVL